MKRTIRVDPPVLEGQHGVDVVKTGIARVLDDQDPRQTAPQGLDRIAMGVEEEGPGIRGGKGIVELFARLDRVLGLDGIAVEDELP